MSRAISLAVAFGLLLVPAVASAHDEPGPQKADNKALGEAAREGAEGAEKEEPEPPWEFSADIIGGATTTDAITAGRPARIELPPLNVFDSTRVSAYTFLFGIERHLGERFAVGARMPFIAADLSSTPTAELLLSECVCPCRSRNQRARWLRRRILTATCGRRARTSRASARHRSAKRPDTLRDDLETLVQGSSPRREDERPSTMNRMLMRSWLGHGPPAPTERSMGRVERSVVE